MFGIITRTFNRVKEELYTISEYYDSVYQHKNSSSNRAAFNVCGGKAYKPSIWNYLPLSLVTSCFKSLVLVSRYVMFGEYTEEPCCRGAEINERNNNIRNTVYHRLPGNPPSTPPLLTKGNLKSINVDVSSLLIARSTIPNPTDTVKDLLA